MKHRTRKQQYADYYDVFKAVQGDKKVKRHGAKDGSIPTHPVVEVMGMPESTVVIECLTWFKQHHIFHNRHDVGAGDIAGYGYATYGIKGAGDIIGLLPTGQHFEIECKRGKGGRLSLGQQKRMRNIRANNGVYLICHGVEELEHYFKDLV